MSARGGHKPARYRCKK